MKIIKFVRVNLVVNLFLVSIFLMSTNFSYAMSTPDFYDYDYILNQIPSKYFKDIKSTINLGFHASEYFYKTKDYIKAKKWSTNIGRFINYSALNTFDKIRYASRKTKGFFTPKNWSTAIGGFVADTVSHTVNKEGGIKDTLDINKGIKSATKATGKLFKEDGEGRKTVQKACSMISEELQNDGALREVLRAPISAVKEEMVEGGEIREVFNEGLKFTDEYGSALNDQIKKAGTTISKNTIKTAAGVAGCAVGVIGAWYGSKLLFNYVNKSLKTPSLIIESSFKGFYEKAKNLIISKPNNFRTMIFEKDLQERLGNIVKSTKNIYQKIKEGKKNIKYRNLLLYGPPGTGKTMFAKELAKQSNMPYVMITGASFIQFKNGQGVTAMNELFSWANKSKTGFILIIDEADSFLYDRSQMKPSSQAYHLLNNFLNHTGEGSQKFMIVMCANHKDNIDSAVASRINDYIDVPLPKKLERAKVLTLYKNIILLDKTQNTEEFVKSVSLLDNKKIFEIADKTVGLSNRELENIINTIKTDSDISPNGTVSIKIIDNVVKRTVEKHNSLVKA